MDRKLPDGCISFEWSEYGLSSTYTDNFIFMVFLFHVEKGSGITECTS